MLACRNSISGKRQKLAEKCAEPPPTTRPYWIHGVFFASSVSVSRKVAGCVFGLFVSPFSTWIPELVVLHAARLDPGSLLEHDDGVSGSAQFTRQNPARGSGPHDHEVHFGIRRVLLHRRLFGRDRSVMVQVGGIRHGRRIRRVGTRRTGRRSRASSSRPSRNSRRKMDPRTSRAW